MSEGHWEVIRADVVHGDDVGMVAEFDQSRSEAGDVVKKSRAYMVFALTDDVEGMQALCGITPGTSSQAFFVGCLHALKEIVLSEQEASSGEEA